jgi:hypothetical protein
MSGPGLMGWLDTCEISLWLTVMFLSPSAQTQVACQYLGPMQDGLSHLTC